MKLLAGRPKDLEDATALLRTHPAINLRGLESDVEALRAALGEDDVAHNLAFVRRAARNSASKRRRTT
jgi:hypothetical protein